MNTRTMAFACAAAVCGAAFAAEEAESTGWEYTPNQFRYVGKEAAAYIMEKGICLEEFLDAYARAKEQQLNE